MSLRKAITIGLPAAICAVVLSMAGIEAWVRLAWDYSRGTPGFFLSDAWRGQRLAPGYDGWFAGVPVKINSLGFRDPREYALEKGRDTFRILVFGDSVTFGHGATFETTYPYLLEQRLRQWRGDVDWQVWNLGVPGYNTRQELTYLKEVGARYQPDLVVIGFYRNDFSDNEATGNPGWRARAAVPVVRTMQRHLYSFELYKRIYLTARWRLAGDDTLSRQVEHLQTESALLARAEPLADAPEQRLTPVEYFDDEELAAFECISMPRVDPSKPGELAERIRARSPELVPWLDAVSEIQQLARDGVYRIVFFINSAPEICHDFDRFYDGGSLADDRALLTLLSQGTPVVSSTRAFLHYRPSQMPLAAGHSLGNANVVKADVLFEFLREQRLLERR